MDPCVIIKTKGFITFRKSIQDQIEVKSLLEYIAPLRADFKSNTDSRIYYRITNSSFTVSWTNMYLDYKNSTTPNYKYSFQCQIFANGNINFVYNHIPVQLDTITQRWISDRNRNLIIYKNSFAKLYVISYLIYSIGNPPKSNLHGKGDTKYGPVIVGMRYRPCANPVAEIGFHNRDFNDV